MGVQPFGKGFHISLQTHSTHILKRCVLLPAKLACLYRLCIAFISHVWVAFGFKVLLTWMWKENIQTIANLRMERGGDVLAPLEVFGARTLL